MRIASLRRLVAQGEGATIEFKRSTGELREGMEALCGMLNAAGKGQVLFGVSNSGEILGLPIADKTLREVANASRRIEPVAEVTPIWRSSYGSRPPSPRWTSGLLSRHIPARRRSSLP